MSCRNSIKVSPFQQGIRLKISSTYSLKEKINNYSSGCRWWSGSGIGHYTWHIFKIFGRIKKPTSGITGSVAIIPGGTPCICEYRLDRRKFHDVISSKKNVRLDENLYFLLDVDEVRKNQNFAPAELNLLEMQIFVTSMIDINFRMLLVPNWNLRILKKMLAVERKRLFLRRHLWCRQTSQICDIWTKLHDVTGCKFELANLKEKVCTWAKLSVFKATLINLASIEHPKAFRMNGLFDIN